MNGVAILQFLGHLQRSQTFCFAINVHASVELDL